MNLKQTLFVMNYTEGEGKGNATKAAKMASYSEKTAYSIGQRLLKNVEIAKAISNAIEVLKTAWKDRISKVLARLQREIDSTTSVSQLCLLVNAQKGYMDMQAKNEGQYAEDNAQKAEQVKLDKAETLECRRIANIINLDEARKGKAG